MRLGHGAHDASETVEGSRPDEAPLTKRIIDDVREWDAIRADWDRLYQASPTASTPLDFVWLRKWWDVYGPVYGRGGLRIISLWRGSRLVGVLPLYLDVGRGTSFGVRCLRFISTGEAEYEETCPDYLNLLHLPDDGDACAQAAWAAVAAMQWDTLELLDLPDDTPLLRARGAFPHDAGLQVLSRGACPIAFIGDGFEAYLARLSSKSRMRARQEVRKVERSGALFELASAADAEQYFDDLIRLHQERWTAEGRPGCFAAPRFTEFHRGLVREWVASGRVILARLSHRASTFVVLYGFVTGRKFDLYQLGVASDERAIIHSPGMATNLLLMAQLAEREMDQYDFLRGTSTFKKSLTTEQRALICLACGRPTARAALGEARRLLARAGRKVAQLVSRGLSPWHSP
jgi:CelD/BcsL family acetyltransferase involved in cellulose biosynthesis